MSMDPQTSSFAPNPDIWRLSTTVRGVLDTQQDHAERILRLERRQDEDSRVKSLWGASSPFPGVIGGTPQHGPSQHPSNVDFSNFDDDQSNNMIRSLHLDADDEPRRLGAASRANSVRFDESANQGQWSHPSRNSMDLMPRTSSGFNGLGGHPMFERASSHKSDGRHSSAGHSASGRANSFGNNLGLDALSPLGPSATDAPGLAPGLFILGSVPSIIRCWLDTNFKHETLLYAAICSGSYKSFLDSRLIEELGYSNSIKQDINGSRKIKLPVYLPEAVPQSTMSRPSSPTSQLPCVSVDFTVADYDLSTPSSSKAIQIFLGSDTLRAHNADILFSSNSMVLFDDERTKLSIPFVRPENDVTFKSLRIGTTLAVSSTTFNPVDERPNLRPLPNGVARQSFINGGMSDAYDAQGASESRETEGLNDDIVSKAATSRDSSTTRTTDRQADESKVTMAQLNTNRMEAREGQEVSTPLTATARSGSSPAIWNNWRRDGSSQASASGDWASASKGAAATYARPNRDQGIKVLKPTRQPSRSSAAPTVTSSSVAISQPRKPDAGDAAVLSRSTSGDITKASGREPVGPGGKASSANPIGGASAFGWLNSSGQQRS